MRNIKPLYDGIKVNVAVTSDNHIDTNSGELKKRIKNIKKVLEDVGNSESRINAYITVGDNTSRGLEKNWEVFAGCFERTDFADNIMLALGNHDTWHENGIETALKNFFDYSKKICGYELDKAYFSKNINGYSFIFLGATGKAENEDCALFGQEEIQWFENELNTACENGKPVFVFNHQSINNNHGLPKTWDRKEEDWASDVGGIGIESDEIKNILSKHKNVYYFSGHSHMGLCGEKSYKENGYASFEQHGGVNYINLPCLTRSNHHGEYNKTGMGIIIEVYDDKVVIRPRNFVKRKMNKKVIIKDGKNYFEEKIK